jgi:hypothetical protein
MNRERITSSSQQQMAHKENMTSCGYTHIPHFPFDRLSLSSDDFSWVSLVGTLQVNKKDFAATDDASEIIIIQIFGSKSPNLLYLSFLINLFVRFPSADAIQI